MTVARKVTSLLLLLTLGSLLGIVTFTVFLVRTTTDAVFLVGSILEVRLLQQLQIHNLRIRDGDDGLRELQRGFIEDFDGLVNALESGGRTVKATGKVDTRTLMRRLESISSNPALDLTASTKETVQALNEGLPEPPAEIREQAGIVLREWRQLKVPLLTIAQRPIDDADAQAAYEVISANRDAIIGASRALSITVAGRIVRQRTTMLAVMASIGALSVGLFFVGLVFARRYISQPIEALHHATDKVLKGDFSHRAPILSNDEIAELASRFNSMLDELNRSVVRYRELFENANDFVYIVDLDGRFLSVNKAVESICGYTREELLEKRLDDIVAPEHAQISWQMREAKISGGQETTVYELDIIRKDGSRFTLENSTRVMKENGKAIGFQGVGRDVTERKRLQEQLRTAQKMEVVGRFAGGIAHDFGNVLTIINGYCSMILNRVKVDDRLRSEIEGIQRAGQRAAGLIRHLLGFSKGQIFRPRLIRVDIALAEMQEMLERLVGEDVRLNIEVPRDIGAIRFDPIQLEQVIVNLVLNAKDSMPSGGRVTISAKTKLVEKSLTPQPEDNVPGEYVCLNLSDTGHGMSQGVLSQIFEPFFSTKENGTGLGLSTVYGIVRQSGGHILASSELHVGTTFTLMLPRIEEPIDYLEIKEAGRPPGGTERILLVEDQEDVRRIVRAMLASAGYFVLEAIDQSHAVQISQDSNQQIDMMLTDVVMPHVSGPQLASAVRRIRPNLKVVYMSGYPRDKFERDGVQKDIIHFIQKPLSPETLLGKVREVLDGAERG